LTLRVNQSLAKTTAIVNCRSARPPRLIQIDAPFSSRLSRDTVQPADPIEWMYLKDIVDYTWEIRRLRKYQVQLVVGKFLRQAREVFQPKEMRQWEERIATVG
jgi:hypothetical protein